MSLIAKETGNIDFERLEPGVYQSVCYKVSDIGTHEREYMGKLNRNHQIILLFEVDQRITEGDYKGKRFVVSEFLTLSLHEKSNLRKRIEAWLGRELNKEELSVGFDLECLVGKNCMLSIIDVKKGDKTYPIIQSITPIPKNMEKIEPELFEEPKWIEKLRSNSLEATGIIDREEDNNTEQEEKKK